MFLGFGCRRNVRTRQDATIEEKADCRRLHMTPRHHASFEAAHGQSKPHQSPNTPTRLESGPGLVGTGASNVVQREDDRVVRMITIPINHLTNIVVPLLLYMPPAGLG